MILFCDMERNKVSTPLLDKKKADLLTQTILYNKAEDTYGVHVDGTLQELLHVQLDLRLRESDAGVVQQSA